MSTQRILLILNIKIFLLFYVFSGFTLDSDFAFKYFSAFTLVNLAFGAFWLLVNPDVLFNIIAFPFVLSWKIVSFPFTR